jgi:hypothetical protein
MTNRPLNKCGSLDRRFKINKTLEAREWLFWQAYGNLVIAGLFGLIAGAILSVSLFRARNASSPPLAPPSENLDVGTVKGVGKSLVAPVEALETPYCYDTLTCIRDVGEDLDVPNQDILTMIRIARAESGLRADAMNRNSNGTFDLGVFQINDVHSKRISRADRLDFEKNIRFAYTLYQEQGFGPWSASKAVWNR